MDTPLQDRQAIADLATGWMHRDLGEWDALRNLFHPDATIEVTWFEGPATEFVDASSRMQGSGLRTKHLISPPMIRFHGDKALAETNAIIMVDSDALGLGATTHSRFFDRVERRDGTWRIARRLCIYDMSAFDFLAPVEVDRSTIERYPRAYAALAYLLDQSGFPVRRVFPTQGSELERTIHADGRAWLGA